MKYYYEEEFCGGYRQLMPVTYGKDSSGTYRKQGMACDCKTEQCKLETCKHFQKAPEELPVKELRNKKIGEH